MLFLVLTAPLLVAVLFWRRPVPASHTFVCDMREGSAFWKKIAEYSNAFLSQDTRIKSTCMGIEWFRSDDCGIIFNRPSADIKIQMDFANTPASVVTAVLIALENHGFILQ